MELPVSSTYLRNLKFTSGHGAGADGTYTTLLVKSLLTGLSQHSSRFRRQV